MRNKYMNYGSYKESVLNMSKVMGLCGHAWGGTRRREMDEREKLNRV